MSRIGKQPISVPDGVEVIIDDTTVTVKGKLGTLTESQKPRIKVICADGVIQVTRATDDGPTRALHGLMRALLANMVHGVVSGYSKTLDMVGVGYKAQVGGGKLILNAGYSHRVEIAAPTGVSFQVDGDTAITVSGFDKQKVGQVASDIRVVRKPEPYKGKGIKYRDEIVRRKAGKAGKA